MSSGTSRLKSIWRVAGALIAIVASIYFVRELSRHWEQIRHLPVSEAVVAGVIAATLLQAGSLVLDGVAWRWLLNALRVPASTRAALRIFLLAQFAKYVPGNVAHHIGRVALCQRLGWPTAPVVLSMLIETGFALGVGALVALTGLVQVSFEERSAPALWLAAGLLSVGWLSGTWLLRRLLAEPPARLRKLLALEPPVVLSARLLATYSLVLLLGMLGFGLGFALLLVVLTGQWSWQLSLVPGAVSLAWLFGVLVPGAPAGLGVREAAITAMLAPVFGASVIAAAAVLWRISNSLADVLMFAVGMAIRDSDQAAAQIS